MTKNAILYVDDEQENLDGFKYIFQNTYEVFIAISAHEALKILKRQKIKVLIADQRMPGTSGTELLEHVSEEYPQITRIILTAYADFDVLLKAINKAKVYRFLIKPWNKEDFKITLDNAIETYDLKENNALLINNLKITNAELTTSNKQLKHEIEKRKKATNALKINEEKYRILVEGQTDLIAKIDHNNNFLFVSPSYCEILKKKEVDLLGKNFIDQFDPSEKDSAFRSMHNTHVYPHTSHLEQKIEREKGTMHIAWSNRALLNEKKEVKEIICVGRDITQLKKTEKKLFNYLEELSVLNKITHELIKRLTVEEVIQTTLNLILSPTNADLALVFILNNDNGILELKGYKTLKSDYMHDDKPIHKIGLCLCGLCAKYNTLVFSKNIHKDNRCKLNECKEAGVKSFCGIPLVGNNKTIGVLGLATFYDYKDFQVKKTFLETLGNEISICLQNAIFYEEINNQKNKLAETNVFLKKEIQQREKAETALKISEERYRTLFEYAADGILVGNENGIIINANSRIQKMTGYTKEEIVLKNISYLFPPTEIIEKPLRYDLIKSGAIVTMERTILRKDGKLLPVEMSTKQLTDGRLQTYLRDITERKISEQKLIETKNFLEGINIASPDYIFILDLRIKKLSFYNKKFVEALQYSNKEIEESEDIFGKIVLKDDIPIFKEHQKKIQQSKTNEIFSAELRLLTKEQQVKWVLLREQVYVRDNANIALQTLGVITDISERKNVEIALKESEIKFRNIFNSSIDGIVIIDWEFSFLEINHAFQEKFGYSKNEIKNLTDFVHNDFAQEFIDSIEMLKNEKLIKPIEIEMQNRTGKIFPVEINSKRIDYEGKSAIIILIKDITERKETEKKVLEAIISTEEKEREKFAKNLHDDLGPLLSSIRMYINSFKDTNDEKKQEYIIEHVNMILKEAIQSTKEISNDLSPHILSNYGLLSAIESFIKKIYGELQIDFKSNLKNLRFENSFETSIYRILKELINNTFKHAEATQIKISLNYFDQNLILNYTDNGKGFNYNNLETYSGMGISNIKSRIRTLNGKFIFKRLNEGISYEIEIPAEPLS